MHSHPYYSTREAEQAQMDREAKFVANLFVGVYVGLFVIGIISLFFIK